MNRSPSQPVRRGSAGSRFGWMGMLAGGVALAVLGRPQPGSTCCGPDLLLLGVPGAASCEAPHSAHADGGGGGAGGGSEHGSRASTPGDQPASIASSGLKFGLVEVDARARTVSFPARLNMSEGLIEYVLVTDYGKTHESLLTTEAKPMDIQSALLLLNAVPAGTNAVAGPDSAVPARSAVRVGVRRESPTSLALEAVESWVGTREAGREGVSLETSPWLFNGSYISPEGFAAHFEGSIISLIRDPVAILNNPRRGRDDDELHVPRTEAVPAVGSVVTVVLQVGEARP